MARIAGTRITEPRATIFVVGLLLITSAVGSWLIGGGSQPELARATRPIPDDGISLETPEGKGLLFESEAHEPFLPLMSHFTTQINKAYCGVASIAMVLNALDVRAPVSRRHAPYRLFTQTNILNGRTNAITTSVKVSREGMDLETVANLLQVYGVKAVAHRAGTSDVDEFRKTAADYLSREKHHVIVNYSRKVMQQEGLGHISPLAAYDADSDRFLILDVSRYKAPPIWVPTERLFEAMAKPVDDEGHTLGFVLVRRP